MKEGSSDGSNALSRPPIKDWGEKIFESRSNEKFPCIIPKYFLYGPENYRLRFVESELRNEFFNSMKASETPQAKSVIFRHAHFQINVKERKLYNLFSGYL